MKTADIVIGLTAAAGIAVAVFAVVSSRRPAPGVQPVRSYVPIVSGGSYTGMNAGSTVPDEYWNTHTNF